MGMLHGVGSIRISAVVGRRVPRITHGSCCGRCCRCCCLVLALALPLALRGCGGGCALGSRGWRCQQGKRQRTSLSVEKQREPICFAGGIATFPFPCVGGLQFLDAPLDGIEPRRLDLANLVLGIFNAECLSHLLLIVVAGEFLCLVHLSEVDEAEPAVPLCLRITWKEQKIIATLVGFVEHLNELGAGESRRDVLEHEHRCGGRAWQHARKRRWWRPRWRHHRCVGWRHHVRWHHVACWPHRSGRCHRRTATASTLLIACCTEGLRKGDLLALFIQEQGLPLGLLAQFLDEFLVAQVVHVGIAPLDPCVVYLTHLGAAEARQACCCLSAMELTDKGSCDRWLAEVDEGVTNVALAVEVNRQVDKIILALIALVQSFDEHVPGITIRDVT
mmetsp:Transcript_147005/g.382053  ORF Transcript_147005/g.382053 Transcript_147005/m.382053 type:complete len:390 (+) Transcript_147005:621-1790(+)